MFHSDYAHLTEGLPPSQLAAAVKRLTTGRKAIPAEAVSQLGERQEEVLTAISSAYTRKKERSRASSQKRRDATRNPRQPSESATPPAEEDSSELPAIEAMALDDAQPEPEPEPVEPARASEPKPAPVAPAPVAPVPAPVSAPVPVPASEPKPVPASKPVPEKVGEPVLASRRGRKLFVSQH